MKNEQYSRRGGKPIYDPFKDAAPERQRNTYHIHRKCGACDGTGRGREGYLHVGSLIVDAVSCPNCLEHGSVYVDGKWGKHIELYAYELSEEEYLSLPELKRMSVEAELYIGKQRNKIASYMADNTRFYSKKGEIVVKTFFPAEVEDRGKSVGIR